MSLIVKPSPSSADGRICVGIRIGHTETVGVDLELIGFTTDEVAAEYEANGPIPAHTFITRHLGGGEWVVCSQRPEAPRSGLAAE